MNILMITIVTLVYLIITAFLGYLGFRHTKDTTDFLLAGRKTHPVVMAVSYGSTFISTSAIVGFGGAAAVFGMGVLWLTFLNILVGIFIAFVIFGKRTRKMGHNLDAHTFPELIGKRFDSRFLQGAAGIMVFVAMPLYAGSVIIGGAQFISQTLQISYETALFFFVAIVAVYVIMGGLKGVLYTDAFQGSIMFVGMTILLILTYADWAASSTRTAPFHPSPPKQYGSGARRGTWDGPACRARGQSSGGNSSPPSCSASASACSPSRSLPFAS
jgi:SSS family solute:Na+ symporter